MSDPRVGRERRIRQLVADAAACPLPDRARFLSDACAGDVELRREVDALLAAHDAAGDVFERQPVAPSALAGAGVPLTAGARLTVGRRVGPYEVVEAIGQGGMGEVYRARDTRLGRDVALKVLPPALVNDPVLRERFIQEARAASALEHPHIAVIHEIAEADGVPFIAMEFVRGEPLAAALARGPLGAPRALDLAIEIAEALARAHEKGIVHRDLKPANVIVTEEGHAKIIDFGLAKLLDPVDRGAETHAGTLTEVGTVLGTVSYMSPEQTRGSRVDHRSDVFSFGIVLYEMLSGHLPFRGHARIDTMHAILHDPPPLLPSAVGPAADDLHRILEKCLAKEPDDRYQGMRDLAVDLRAARRRLDSSQLRTAPSLPAISRIEKPRSRAIPIAGAAVLAVLALAVAVLVVGRRSSPPLATSDRSGWEQLTNLDFATQPALSPDGRMLAFIRGSGTFTTAGQIYLKMLPAGESVPLTNDARSKMSPVFSPDGARIAYTVNSSDDPWGTWIVPTLRGDARPWLRNASGLVWIAPGQVMFSEVKRGQHMRVVTSSESRTQSRDIYAPDNELGMAHRSYPSPDGRSVLIVEMDARGVWIPCRLVPFDGSSRGRSVGPHGAPCTGAAWSPDGTWMYLTANRGDGFHVWRQRVPDGDPQQVTSGPTEEEGLALAADGRSAITSVGLRQRSVWIHDAHGERQLSVEGHAMLPLLSGDGRILCYRVTRSVATGQTPSELWMTDVASGRSERLLPGLLVTGYDMSVDDRVVAAAADADGISRLWLAWLDHREPPHRIGELRGDSPRFVSTDDILYRQPDGDGWVLARARTDGTERRLLASVSSSVFGTVSPDGQWLSAALPRQSLVLLSTNGSTVKPVMTGGLVGRLRWSPDGSRLYLSIQVGEASAFAFGRTYIIPLRRGAILPPLPPGGFRSEAEVAVLPGVQVVSHGDVAPGPAANVYAFSRTTITRNLYRVPLP
jgi:serine/threonine protein kinase